MYVISEYMACVALIIAFSALLFGICILLMMISEGMGALVRALRETPSEGTHFFSGAAVPGARHKPFAGAQPAASSVYENAGKDGLTIQRISVSLGDSGNPSPCRRSTGSWNVVA
jgi:hypothetical protein